MVELYAGNIKKSMVELGSHEKTEKFAENTLARCYGHLALTWACCQGKELDLKKERC